MSGAAPLSSNLAEICTKILKCTVKQGYGLTETSPVTHINPDPPDKIVPGSIGICIPNTECRIVDLEKNPVKKAEQGELWIRGPQVMKGYLNNPQATEETIDKDGWLHTGDIAEVDDDGYFKIVDRFKESIKYKGSQVAPTELGALLLTHPAIVDCAVIPMPNEEAGEIPVGFIVLNSKNKVDLDKIFEYITKKVALHKNYGA